MAKTKGDLSDELGSSIVDALNKKFKNDRVQTAYFLDGDDDAPTVVNEWVGSGSTILDFAISNRKHGGYPVGRITELTGLEGAGKSLLAAHALANTQKAGGLAVLIDTENAIAKEWLAAIGVDISKMLYIPMESIEDAFTAMVTVIEKARSSNKNKLITIVLDSIAGASTKDELAADFDKTGYNTGKALIISEAMRKITNFIGRERICVIITNQLRFKMNAPAFADPYTTPGGKGLPYHSSVRIRATPIGVIKDKVNGVEQPIGTKVKIKVGKNRVGPPLRECELELYFDSGIDDYSSWLGVMKDYKLVGQAGAWYSWTDPTTGEIIKFQSKEFVEKLVSDPTRRSIIYDAIAENVIMKYRETDVDMAPRIDDVIVSEEPLDDL